MIKKIIIPRISETNLTKHIGNDIVPVWMEEGYMEIFQLFSKDPYEVNLIVVNINIDFLKEIFFGKDVEILTSVKKIGNASFVLHQEMYQDRNLCVRALTTLVHFDYSIHKPVPIPPRVSEMLRQHMMSNP
ncbi:MAG TPA: thioesterase family protein [Syntrophales bacterium]|nr:thioesterase family protein [Syntrophales bacterium]